MRSGLGGEAPVDSSCESDAGVPDVAYALARPDEIILSPTSAAPIAEHACLKHAGRIGRSAAARQFDETAIELAVQAHVRHQHTDYDEPLARGMERGEARAAVRAAVEGVLDGWRP